MAAVVLFGNSSGSLVDLAVAADTRIRSAAHWNETQRMIKNLCQWFSTTQEDEEFKDLKRSTVETAYPAASYESRTVVFEIPPSAGNLIAQLMRISNEAYGLHCTVPSDTISDTALVLAGRCHGDALDVVSEYTRGGQLSHSDTRIVAVDGGTITCSMFERPLRNAA